MSLKHPYSLKQFMSSNHVLHSFPPNISVLQQDNIYIAIIWIQNVMFLWAQISPNLCDLSTKAPNFVLVKFDSDIGLRKLFQIIWCFLAVIPRSISFKIKVFSGYLVAAWPRSRSSNIRLIDHANMFLGELGAPCSSPAHIASNTWLLYSMSAKATTVSKKA